jgi:hypothetical protein
MTQRIASALTLSLLTWWAQRAPAQSAQEASEETSTATIEQCVSQHEAARQLRVQEQWLGARAAMLSCAEERCPLAIVSDCRAWLDELARVLPSLLIVVERPEPKSDNETLTVELDGVRLSLPEVPAPLELLPGSHRLRFQLGGQPAVERSFVLQKGEKNHVEQVRFAALPAAPPVPPAPPPFVPERPVSAATYWLSAGALAAFAGSTALLVVGVREYHDAQARCAPTCDSSTRTSIESKLVLADVTGGVGVALAGLAVYTYLRRPVVIRGAPSSGPAFAASGNSATLIWRGQF